MFEALCPDVVVVAPHPQCWGQTQGLLLTRQGLYRSSIPALRWGTLGTCLVTEPHLQLDLLLPIFSVHYFFLNYFIFKFYLH